MPRQARLDATGTVHRVIARGIERRAIFRDNEDRRQFTDRLGELTHETKTALYAWVLLPNHVHLLLKERTGRPLAVYAPLDDRVCYNLQSQV